jgi:phosphatidylinositol kinase/protein kinase (PI-3  family)
MSSIMTLGVLREHKDTLLAMLEAFALDPLLTWQAKEVENPAGKSGV